MTYSKKLIRKNKRKNSRTSKIFIGSGPMDEINVNPVEESLNAANIGLDGILYDTRPHMNMLTIIFKTNKDISKFLQIDTLEDKLKIIVDEYKDIKSIVLTYKDDVKKYNFEDIDENIVDINNKFKNEGLYIYSTEDNFAPQFIEKTLYKKDGSPTLILFMKTGDTYAPTYHGGKFGALKYNYKNDNYLLLMERTRNNIAGFGGSPNSDEDDKPQKTVLREMFEELFEKIYRRNLENNKPELTDTEVKDIKKIIKNFFGVEPPDDKIIDWEYLETLLNDNYTTYSDKLTQITSYSNNKIVLKNTFGHKIPTGESVASDTYYYFNTTELFDINLFNLVNKYKSKFEVPRICSINYNNDTYKNFFTTIKIILYNSPNTTSEKFDILIKNYPPEKLLEIFREIIVVDYTYTTVKFTQKNNKIKLIIDGRVNCLYHNLEPLEFIVVEFEKNTINETAGGTSVLPILLNLLPFTATIGGKKRRKTKRKYKHNYHYRSHRNKTRKHHTKKNRK